MNVLVKSQFQYNKGKRLAASIYRESLRGRDTGTNELLAEQLGDEIDVLLVDVDWNRELRLYRMLGQKSLDSAVDRTHRSVRRTRACLRFINDLKRAKTMTRSRSAEEQYSTIKQFEADLALL